MVGNNEHFSLTQPLQQWFDSADNLSAGYIPRRYYRVIVLP